MSIDPTPLPITPAPAEAPKSLFDKLSMALPIALTAMATAFAGMSNGQLQEAMFWRSYASQDQAKATNQWTLAGFKRDRSLICQTTAAQLRATTNQPPNPFIGTTPQGANSLALEWLAGKGPAAPRLPEIADPDLDKLLTDIQAHKPEAELLQQAKKIRMTTINAALDEVEQAADRIDKEWDPTLKTANTLVANVTKEKTTAAQAAGFELEQRRYRLEATMNQTISYRYEARVKITSARSEKHQHKSYYFFYAMLAAQIGATISSLALARKHQSILWGVAGLTGLTALLIAASVYLVDA